MTNCACISKEHKSSIEKSNLDNSIKNLFINIKTCGELTDYNVISIIEECGGIKTIPLKCVINKLKSAGLNKEELTNILLHLRQDNIIQLEVGTPFVDINEIKNVTIETDKNRFAYIKLLRR